MRTRLARTLDHLALALFGTALLIDFSGGIVLPLGGMTLTARSPDRAFLATLFLVGLRLALDRRSPPPAVLQRFWRHIYRPTADQFAPLLREGLGRRRVIVFVAMSVVTAVMLQAQLRQMYSVPDLGDPLFSIWRIGWVYHQMLGDPRALFEANIFYPFPLSLTLSDSMLLPALITAPLLSVGVHPVVAYNVVLVTSFLASAFAGYLLVEALTGSTGAGYVAGLLFAFHPFHWEHYAHFELLMVWWIPLSLLALHRFVETARARWAILAALLATAQLYSSMYLAVYYLWTAALVFVLLCVLTRPPLRRLVVSAVIAGAIALALAAPLSQRYEAARLNDRPSEEVNRYSADLSDYQRAQSRSALWAERALGNAQPERALFPGAVVLILSVMALAPPLGVTRVVYAGALLLSVELTRGYKGILYPVLYDWLPFMRGMRAPARASLLVGLALAVLAGVTVRRLLDGRSRGRSLGLLAALTIAIGIDLRPALALEPVWPAPPPIYGPITGRTDVVLAEFPLGLSPGAGITDTPHMYFSLWHWAPLVNGYSGHAPEGQGEFMAAMRPFPAPATLALLRARGVTHVTINCALYAEGCEALLARVEATPQLRELAAARWQRKPVKLYELRAP